MQLLWWSRGQPTEAETWPTEHRLPPLPEPQPDPAPADTPAGITSSPSKNPGSSTGRGAPAEASRATVRDFHSNSIDACARSLPTAMAASNGEPSSSRGPRQTGGAWSRGPLSKPVDAAPNKSKQSLLPSLIRAASDTSSPQIGGLLCLPVKLRILRKACLQPCLQEHKLRWMMAHTSIPTA